MRRLIVYALDLPAPVLEAIYPWRRPHPQLDAGGPNLLRRQTVPGPQKQRRISESAFEIERELVG
jgi:hypothetical protein